MESKLSAVEQALQELYRAERQVVQDGPDDADMLGYATLEGHLAGLREAIRIVREISRA